MKRAYKAALTFALCILSWSAVAWTQEQTDETPSGEAAESETAAPAPDEAPPQSEAGEESPEPADENAEAEIHLQLLEKGESFEIYRFNFSSELLVSS